MTFARDIEASLVAAVALVNSAERPDTMTTLQQLDTYLVDHEFTGSRTYNTTELASIRTLRPKLRTLLLSPMDEAVTIVNQMLLSNGASPQLERHGDSSWHIHAVSADRPLAIRIEVETAMAMIDVIRTDEMSRLGLCVDDVCQGVVLDLSRNRSRRFCSTTCGNRAAVAAYRARHSSR
jgi:predicted RNA-binding Zn ribbon-like protein